MADASKCDMCGNYFDNDSNIKFKTKDGDDSETVGSGKIAIYGFPKGMEKNLCYNCMYRLLANFDVKIKEKMR